MCPPFSLVTTLIFLVIEFMRALIRLMGMLFHSSTRARVNWARVAGGGLHCRACLSNSSHRCSVGDKSGLYGGQSSGWALLFARKTWQILVTWGLALSCCRVRLCCCKKGITWGRRISSLYLAAVKLPSITTNFNPYEIPPHTITDPPQNLSLSTTQASAKRSHELYDQEN